MSNFVYLCWKYFLSCLGKCPVWSKLIFFLSHVKRSCGYVSRSVPIYGSWIIYNDVDDDHSYCFLKWFSKSNDSIFFKLFFLINKHKTPNFLVLLPVLHSLHVVVHIHEPTQPGSVEGCITAGRVHAHLLLIAIPCSK